MSSFGVVLDACVLYPAPLRDTLLRAAQKGLYRIYCSNFILDEVSRNLIQDGRTTPDGAARLVAAIRQIFPESIVADEIIKTLESSMQNQEKDRHVLAAAVAANAQMIVTFNLKDFPDSALAPSDVEAKHPDTFLLSAFDLSKATMYELLKEQAAALQKPPIPLDDLLSILSGSIPKTIEAVRHYIDNAVADDDSGAWGST